LLNLILVVPVFGQTTADQQQTNHNNSEPANVIGPGSNSKPLAVDEDPAMIGKRNLNHGLISKMSMSPEKEVALGRQLAAEVDRQAKFIDDPIITEYVNRVAQNLVLHSDAKAIHSSITTTYQSITAIH
jgi:hypothetical protein